MSHYQLNPAVSPPLRILMSWIGASFVDRRRLLHPRRRAVPLEWGLLADGPVMQAEVETLDLVIIIVG